MEKTTIAFVIQSLSSGGAERVVSTLANELSEKYNVIIITLIKFKPFYTLSPGIKVLYCVDSVRPSRNMLEAVVSNFKLCKRISKILQEEQVNLAIGFLTTANVLTVLAGRYNNIPVIISERNNPYISHLPAFWQLLRRFTYPKADYLVVQTKVIENYFSKLIEAQRLKILPNPIASSLTLQREINIIRKKTVLNVGSLTHQKAQDHLIRAFSAINKAGWELHIIGRGRRENEYRELIKSLNMGDRIKIYPPTKQIESAYNSASIFAFTSVYEGFPNALIEAMHFGLASVSTDCPTGPSELIRDGENGYLVALNDQNALQGRLEQLMDDEELRKIFAVRAVESVKRFEAKEIVKEWDNLIERVLERE